jgi:hypothetical protein
MNTPMNDPELDALLGAYALDALDGEERALVEEYLEHNPRARAEVDELRESAAALALAPVGDLRAPDGRWGRIAASIVETEAPAAQPVSLAEQRDRRRRLTTRAGALIAVAASIVVVVLAVQVVSLRGRLDDAAEPGAASASAAFEKATAVDGAREVALVPEKGAEVARIVLLPDGTGYLKNDGMRPLEPDQTYQLWVLTGATDDPIVISAGVLGADPKAAAFKAAGDVHGFALTVEDSPGVVSSQQPAYASATLS